MNPDWQKAKEKATGKIDGLFLNSLNYLSKILPRAFLQKEILEKWMAAYNIPPGTILDPKTVGIVMAGNIPLVGFHDLLCVFITGHNALIKASSKDEVLIKHLVEKMADGMNEIE